MVLKYQVLTRRFTPKLFGSEATHLLKFNDYLPSPLTGTDGGTYFKITLSPSMNFLDNSPFSRWYGVSEGLTNGSITPYNADGQVNFTQTQVASFEHAQFCLSFRYEITFDLNNATIPLLAVRVIRHNQTNATSLIGTPDVASMSGGSIPLNIFRNVF